MWIKKEWNSLNNYKISTSGIGKWNKNMQCSANIFKWKQDSKALKSLHLILFAIFGVLDLENWNY